MKINEKITDEKLYQLCKIYGERARFWRQKFIGLLPEVFKRELYRKHGFGSIFEFAAKLAGVSEEQVGRVLGLDKKFQDKPELHKALVNGEVSINKLRRIAPIATQENQNFLLEQVKILPQKAIETFVRDIKAHSLRSCVGRAPKPNEQLPILQGSATDGIQEANLGLAQDLKEKLLELKLSSEVTQKLLELQRKGININQLLLEFLEKREQEIAEEKEKLANAQNTEKTSRHIPVKIEKLIQREHGDRCAVPNCQKNAEQIHHTLPFAILKNHNPYFLKPLCKQHHAISHGISLAYSKRSTG